MNASDVRELSVKGKRRAEREIEKYIPVFIFKNKEEIAEQASMGYTSSNVLYNNMFSKSPKSELTSLESRLMLDRVCRYFTNRGFRYRHDGDLYQHHTFFWNSDEPCVQPAKISSLKEIRLFVEIDPKCDVILISSGLVFLNGLALEQDCHYELAEERKQTKQTKQTKKGK